MKFLRRVINNWFNLPYTNVCIALHTQCLLSVLEKTSQSTRAGFEPTTSCLLVQTSQPLDHRACLMTIAQLEPSRTKISNSIFQLEFFQDWELTHNQLDTIGFSWTFSPLILDLIGLDWTFSQLDKIGSNWTFVGK